MAIVQQLTRVLVSRPAGVAVEGMRLRTFVGEGDIEHWLAIRREAFARERVGVRDWDRDDFAREFLRKPWWRPEAMWFAEAVEARSAGERPPSVPVGTVTLARRGDPPFDVPVVHWLAVRRSYRRRGIARWLVATLEAAVWDAGGRQVWLETHSAWREAGRLYESLGYRAAEE